MKNIFKTSFIIIFMIIIISNISYAIIQNNENINNKEISGKNFFETNKTIISKGNTLEMTIDITKIEYDNFKFDLTTNIKTNEIYTNNEIEIEQNNEQEVNQEDETQNNILSFEFDKTNMKLNKITLYYNIPQDAEIGEKINLLAQISVKNDNNQEYEKVNEKEIEIEIVNEENDNKENLEGDINKNQNKENQQEIQNNNNESLTGLLKSAQTIQINSVSMSSNVDSKNVAVYNGSSNNYLSDISIEGVTLNTTFNKEKTNYFATVEGKESLDINVTKEDSSAIVKIEGENNLKNGNNKILISVTAENGDVRYYRIFITNN